jgi:hypothetical protein
MITREVMKTVFEKANRTGFHHFTTPALPMKRGSEAAFDGLGGLMVVSLSAGILVLMRFLLAN